MKKILAMLLAVLMVFTFVACTNDDANDDTSKDDGTENQNPDNGGEEKNENVIEPDASAKDTLGYLYFEKLVEVKTADPTANSEAVVEAIMTSKLGTAFPGCMTAPIEPDSYLQGIGTDGATFGGFATGTVIIPMMMGQPFIVYVFDLAEDADVAAFVESVKTNANPAWNICTVAETTTVGACYNTVVLAMCQKDIPSSVSGIAAIIEPEVGDGSAAATVWETFKTVMSEMNTPELWAEEIANALSAKGVAGTVEGIMDVIKNDIFVYEIDSYNGATITDGDKVIYIFQLEAGIDVANWTDYNCSAKEGADLVFGAYNETVIVLTNFNK